MISLKERAQKAVLWNVGFNLFRDGLQFATMLVLVRLLEPSAYGMFALATSIVSFVAILSHNNFLAHSLQPRTDAEVDYQLHFSAGLFFQSMAFLVTNVIALILYHFDDYASVAPLLSVLSLTFFLEWPGELRRKMLERALDWRRLRLLHALGLLLGALLSVAMAAMGAGVYALIVPAPLTVVPFVIELFLTGWRPDFRWSWAAYRPSFRFGLLRTGSGFIATARPLAENAVLVATAGFALTGIYTRALQLILVGQPELRATLKRPDLRQFVQRVALDYHLEPLGREETTAYIAHRLEVAGASRPLFTPEACAAVHYFSQGLPRLINSL